LTSLEHTEFELGDSGTGLVLSSAEDDEAKGEQAGAVNDREGDDVDERARALDCGVGARRPLRSYSPKQLP
jgi:hypothetical protein